MKVVFTVVVIVLIATMGALYGGYYDVAATTPHAPATRWLLGAVMENSVRYHAREITAPDLDAPDRVRLGARHYEEMCVSCHGAPGRERGEVGQGLTPEPPDLARSAGDWRPRELFWIIKHGVRMTGMPAWGATHDDAALWGLTAFVGRLPDMTPADYRTWVRAARQAAGPDGHAHTHGQPH